MTDSRIKVLLVEDIALAQKVAQPILATCNCDADIASTGTQALQFLKDNDYDFVLMDLGLPDIDGITLAETIRNTDNRNLYTPIIALTAHSDEEQKRGCLEAGMNDYLLKPLTKEQCQAIIETYLTTQKVA